MVVYVIDDMTDDEISKINWADENALLKIRKKYDQFVWIPMPKENINDMYMCQSEDGTKSCKITVQEVEGEKVAYCTEHESTAMAGRLYGNTYSVYDSKITTQITQREPERENLIP